MPLQRRVPARHRVAIINRKRQCIAFQPFQREERNAEAYENDKRCDQPQSENDRCDERRHGDMEFSERRSGCR